MKIVTPNLTMSVINRGESFLLYLELRVPIGHSQPKQLRSSLEPTIKNSRHFSGAGKAICCMKGNQYLWNQRAPGTIVLQLLRVHLQDKA